MQGLEEDASEAEVRNGKASYHGTEWRNSHALCMGRSRRWFRRQCVPWLLRDTSGVSPSSGEGSSEQGSKWSSHQSTMTRGSRESNHTGRAGRGLKVKVNLPICKDEKTKDAVTYCSWWWDISIFHHSRWDNQHLLPYIFWSLQGSPGDLVRILGMDATLTDVLQMLDEHYGMVMTFNALSKELYSLKQGSVENVANLSVHLLQQVQILQLEYPGRIQQEHMKEMKWECFYEGLNSKYWCMLVHKVDGENPTSYSNLLLLTQKWERWAEARDLLLLKMTTTGGSNVTWIQTSGNLFPSRKLKGNHTFTALSAIVESTGTKENSSVKPKGEDEAESSDGEDPETSSEIGRAHQPFGYIIHFANAVDLYQKKNWNCFGCGSPDNLVKDCPKYLSKTTRKKSWNVKEGTMKKGGQTPQNPVAAQLASPDKAPRA